MHMHMKHRLPSFRSILHGHGHGLTVVSAFNDATDALDTEKQVTHFFLRHVLEPLDTSLRADENMPWDQWFEVDQSVTEFGRVKDFGRAYSVLAERERRHRKKQYDETKYKKYSNLPSPPWFPLSH